VLGIPGLPPSFTLNGLQAFNLGLAQTMTYATGDPTVATTYPYYAVYVQDSWKARPNLTFDFGLRYELDVHSAPMPVDKNNIGARPPHDRPRRFRALLCASLLFRGLRHSRAQQRERIPPDRAGIRHLGQSGAVQHGQHLQHAGAPGRDHDPDTHAQHHRAGSRT